MRKMTLSMIPCALLWLVPMGVLSVGLMSGCEQEGYEPVEEVGEGIEEGGEEIGEGVGVDEPGLGE